MPSHGRPNKTFALNYECYPTRHSHQVADFGAREVESPKGALGALESWPTKVNAKQQSSKSAAQDLSVKSATHWNKEGIIEIGNEFASVEALWSQFENVMGNGQRTEEEAGASQQSDGRNGDGGQS